MVQFQGKPQLQILLACCAGITASSSSSRSPDTPSTGAHQQPRDLPSVAFDTANWTFDPGVVVTRNGPNGTQVCITGNPHAYVKATVKVPAADLPGGSVDLDSPCSKALQSMCATDEAKADSLVVTETCGVCAKRQQRELRGAACSHQDIQTYCASGSSSSIYYFVVDSQLHAIVPGADEYMGPKLKVNGAQNANDHVAEILHMSLDDVWMPAVVMVTPSTFKRDTQLVFEISIQQASGQFCVRSPRLSFSLPPASYQYPFRAPASSIVTVAVDPKQQSPFRPNLLSANSQLVSGAKWNLGYSNASMQHLLEWLQLPQLRFPGGTVGNFYNWRSDEFYPSNPCNNHAGLKPGFKFGFDGYAQSMKATNATSVLMFNVIADSAAESVARLRSRVAGGLTIDWVELGNENYAIAQSCGRINPNNTSPPLASDYIAFTSTVVSALRYSHTRLAAPLDAQAWVGGWNDGLITATTESGAPLFDGFVLHPYTRVDAPFTPATVAQVLQSSGVMRQTLSQYVNRTNSLQVGKVRPVLLTEYGILGTDTGTFIQSLGQASMFLGIVAAVYEDGIDIVQAGLHILFGGSTTASAMFSFDPSRGQIVATPNGVIYKKLVSVMIGSTVLSSTVQGPSLPPGIPAVDVQALRGSDGKLRLLVVNKLGVVATIHSIVEGLPHAVCTVQEFTQAPLSFSTWPLSEVEAQWTSDASDGPTFTVEPVSIAVATLC